ncbi:hypothetical protein KRP22_008699 [Phytophthora ramorum]|uniref:Cilia- and flagella-associated protein 43 n=1 Tax=Phytophthora ramorum TaxID=164328 RepID=UPI0030A4353B|nr:Cilia- and flagella-associated protein 43 [Phytophthora ramorum]KAH7502057.1 Cilia- and flagella-associated protein 43 [Phytophthora ramorum]
MSVDATVRHVFGYDGSAGDSPPLQLADENTLVYVSGHTLHFTSTSTRSQHFLLRPEPRKIVAFDFNWKTSTFAITTREPEATIALYSYPDKKPKAQLELKGASDDIYEYSLIKFSRCGRRLLSIRPAPPDVEDIGSEKNKAAEAREPLLCVWDVETLAPVPGCEQSSVRGPARFASFDPANVDQFVVGGDSGLQVWKVYTGSAASSSLLRAETVTVPSPSKEDVGQPTDPADIAEWEDKRKQFSCHAWLPQSRLLVANQAGDLLLVDVAETKVAQHIRTAARPDRCPIAGLVVTSETVVVAYSDGALAWLQMDNWELLNTGILPGELTGSVVTVMAPTPTFAKAYVGTRNGKIFEVRTSVMQDDDEDAENEDDEGTARSSASRPSSRGGSDESSLVSPCASFPTGPACDSAVLTPFGGAFAADALIATGGLNGHLALWNLRECRPVAEVNIAALFTQDPTTIGATGSSSRPGTASAASMDLSAGTANPPSLVVIAALASRPGDPIVMIGDHQGRLRSLCVAKVVGGGGKVEILPQHSVQLLPSDAPLDLLSIHPTQTVLMAASTNSGAVFLLSMDHERRFPVQAFFTLGEPNERVVDIQWNATGSSASSSLTLTCFSSRGLFYSARYQAPPPEDVSVGSGASGRRDVSPRGALQIVPKVIAFGESVLPVCARLRFLAGPSSSMMIATSPGRPELTLLKYRDVLRESTEEISILSKMLTKRAHARGVSAVALFPRVLDGGVELLVTGGMDGTVTLWTLAAASAVNARRQMRKSTESDNESKESASGTGGELDEMQATKKRTLVTHAGPVTTLRFVLSRGGAPAEGGGAANVQLISTGVDGCVFLMDVRLSLELYGESIGLSGMQNSDPTMNPLYMSVVSTAKYDDVFQPEREQERTPFLEGRTRAEVVAARDRFDRGKDGTRTKLAELESRLKAMLADNERLPESEQLERQEFVLNVAWRDNLLSQHAARAQRVREGIARDLARMAIVRERMKREFWDVAEVPGVRLTALSPSPSTTAAVAPAVSGGQQPPQTQAPSASSASTGHSAPLFVYNFPMRQQTPLEQKLAKQVATLRLVEFAHQQQEDREGHASDTRARFQETVPDDLQWVLNAGSLHPKAQEATTGNDAPASPEIADYGKTPSYHFVYHPASVRTSKQALVQMHLLESYARSLQSAFNAEFQELVRHKENTMEQIEAKNARIMEITAELNAGGSASDLFRPQWAPEEKADSILKVSPEEMTQQPYETAERRKQRERDTHEAAEREKTRKKDDVGGRALVDMMDGTLEVKKDPLAAQELVKEAWMLTVPPEEMTAEQKKLVTQFEAAQAKFEEEREKYRKSLDLELRKTRGEVIDLCRAFDDKLRALRDRYMATRRAVLAQELYELRLAEKLMAREQLELEAERLEDEARRMQETEASAQSESDRFAAQLEACREELHRATEEDKLLEKSFVRELEEMVHSSGASGTGGTPTASTSQLESPEFTRQLVELYRKRKPDDLVLARDGASGLDVTKRKNSGGVTATRAKGSAKQRLLAESQGSDGSKRSLLLKQLSSKTNVVEPEANLDPFQHLDNLHHDRSRRGSITAVGSGSQKLAVVPLDYTADRPEGVLVEDRIWRALNALRSRKILAEYAVREKTELLALAKTVSDELRTRLADLQYRRRQQQRQRDSLVQRRMGLAESAPLLVRIKQGQDETPVGGGGEDALLVARTGVEALNDVIQLHGKDQVGILGRIKDFRKSINVMEWEHALLELQARDMDERYTDIQLLRVTKDLQELFHTGDTSHKQKREAAMLEAKLAHLGRHHQTTLLKLERTGSQLERQLRERERENRNFQQQVTQLETQVQIREDILASRTSAAMRQQAAGGGVRGDEARLKAIAVRRKLVDLARAQTDEIEFLRLELDKMRRRTFPSFAQAHAREYHDVD